MLSFYGVLGNGVGAIRRSLVVELEDEGSDNGVVLKTVMFAVGHELTEVIIEIGAVGMPLRGGLGPRDEGT